MAATVYTGAGQVSDADVRYVKWVGRTKGGKSVQIEMEKTICRSNPDWKFEEKNETTAEVEFEGLYTDEKLAADDRTEPWKLTVGDGMTAGAGEIILGVGRFYIGTTASDAVAVALTRGGGSFVVEREFHDINADEDPGSVEGRIWKDAARPKLKLTALQWLTKVNKLYSCIEATTSTT
ncbi:MAG: hypothetical protein ACI4P4_15415 [Faecousia sp.]